MRARSVIGALGLAPCLVVLACLAPVCALGAERSIGVVLLHGKLGATADDVEGLAAALTDAGLTVSTPDMAWSALRRFDVTIDLALDEIAREIAAMRTAGVSRVVLAGYSMGANIALAFAARRSGIDGLIVLGPGFMPERAGFRSGVAEAVAEARRNERAGQGRVIGRYLDYGYDGYTYPIDASAASYLSYYAPDGMAVMPANAALMRTALPVLWVVGERDVVAERDRSYAYDLLPPHPRSSFLIIDAGHLDTPRQAAPALIKWLREAP
ncbi:MAG: alpha/beta hydrolase [Alphaproteobacteria bacterium]|nr:alpha/beta hydrolase [Alphaproteobacteria bacterium]